MRRVVPFLSAALLAGCSAAGTPAAPGAAQADWRITLGKPAPAAQGHEPVRCTASFQLADGAYVEIADRYDGLTLGIVRPGASLAGAGAASITLSGAGGTLALPARPLSGGMMVAVITGSNDPRRIIATPFRLTARMGDQTLVDGTLPAVSGATEAAAAPCFAVPAAS